MPTENITNRCFVKWAPCHTAANQTLPSQTHCRFTPQQFQHYPFSSALPVHFLVGQRITDDLSFCIKDKIFFFFFFFSSVILRNNIYRNLCLCNCKYWGRCRTFSPRETTGIDMTRKIIRPAEVQVVTTSKSGK